MNHVPMPSPRSAAPAALSPEEKRARAVAELEARADKAIQEAWEADRAHVEAARFAQSLDTPMMTTPQGFLEGIINSLEIATGVDLDGDESC